MTYSYNRQAADQDNTFGQGYVPLPASLSHLGRFVTNLAPAKLLGHKVLVRGGVHILTCKVNTQLSILTHDLESLLQLGLTNIQCNAPGTLSFYFEGHPVTGAFSLNIRDVLAEAKKCGREAYRSRMKRIPAHDLDFQKYTADMTAMITSPDERTKIRIKATDAWLAGWDEANLANSV